MLGLVDDAELEEPVEGQPSLDLGLLGVQRRVVRHRVRDDGRQHGRLGPTELLDVHAPVRLGRGLTP